MIRQIWLEEKHEFDDTLPKIYEEETGIPFDDGGVINKNKYFGAAEAQLLQDVCTEKYMKETLLWGLLCSILDLEAKAAATSNKLNGVLNIEKEIKKDF